MKTACFRMSYVYLCVMLSLSAQAQQIMFGDPTSTPKKAAQQADHTKSDIKPASTPQEQAPSPDGKAVEIENKSTKPVIYYACVWQNPKEARYELIRINPGTKKSDAFLPIMIGDGTRDRQPVFPFAFEADAKDIAKPKQNGIICYYTDNPYVPSVYTLEKSFPKKIIIEDNPRDSRRPLLTTESSRSFAQSYDKAIDRHKPGSQLVLRNKTQKRVHVYGCVDDKPTIVTVNSGQTLVECPVKTKPLTIMGKKRFALVFEKEGKIVPSIKTCVFEANPFPASVMLVDVEKRDIMQMSIDTVEVPRGTMMYGDNTFEACPLSAPDVQSQAR